MAGKNMLVAASFCAQRCTIQEERFSYENVPGLIHYLAQALDHLYYLDVAAASPEQFGCGPATTTTATATTKYYYYDYCYY